MLFLLIESLIYLIFFEAYKGAREKNLHALNYRDDEDNIT